MKTLSLVLFAGLLVTTAILIALKAAAFTALPWILVLAPIWIPVLLVVMLVIAVFAAMEVFELELEARTKRNKETFEAVLKEIESHNQKAGLN